MYPKPYSIYLRGTIGTELCECNYSLGWVASSDGPTEKARNCVISGPEMNAIWEESQY